MKTLYHGIALVLLFVLNGCQQSPQYNYEETEQNQPDAESSTPTTSIEEKLPESQPPLIGKNFSHPTLPLEMIWVEPGPYWMGSKSESAPKNEKPNALVSISTGFWLAKYETSQELYKALTNENPSEFQHPRQPVENVAYYESDDFCKKLTLFEQEQGRLPQNYIYHLPTESQWEYVAKGGRDATKLDFPPFDHYVWHQGNCRGPNIIGLKEPHPLGFFDLLGNVSELCYGRAAMLPSLPRKDWIGPQDGSFCVARGGNWYVSPSECSTTVRMETLPHFQMATVGFRVALSSILSNQ